MDLLCDQYRSVPNSLFSFSTKHRKKIHTVDSNTGLVSPDSLLFLSVRKTMTLSFPLEGDIGRRVVFQFDGFCFAGKERIGREEEYEWMGEEGVYFKFV